MSRFRGSLLQGTFDSNKRFPVDSRQLVSTKADLINPSIWVVNTLTTNALFNGLFVAVNNDGDNNGIYRLLDRTLITEDNYTAYTTALASGEDTEAYFTMWRKIAEINDLESLAERITVLENSGGGSGGSGTSFTTDETLTLQNGVLSVNTADTAEADNTLPITSAAVQAEIGNINAVLEII